MKLAEKVLSMLEEFDYEKYSRSFEYIEDELEASQDSIKTLTAKMRDADDEEKKKLKKRIDRHKDRINQYRRMLRNKKNEGLDTL